MSKCFCESQSSPQLDFVEVRITGWQPGHIWRWNSKMDSMRWFKVFPGAKEMQNPSKNLQCFQESSKLLQWKVKSSSGFKMRWFKTSASFLCWCGMISPLRPSQTSNVDHWLCQESAKASCTGHIRTCLFTPTGMLDSACQFLSVTFWAISATLTRTVAVKKHTQNHGFEGVQLLNNRVELEWVRVELEWVRVS